MKVEVSEQIIVTSPKVQYHNDYIEAEYNYETTRVEKQGSKIFVSKKFFFSYIFSFKGI